MIAKQIPLTSNKKNTLLGYMNWRNSLSLTEQAYLVDGFAKPKCIFVNFNYKVETYYSLKFPFIHKTKHIVPCKDGKYWYIEHLNGRIQYSENFKH
jgi:hypothetical protein